ncbi:MAG: hypothetical protein U0Q11_27200 [Vicinamibacterales bacterium]
MADNAARNSSKSRPLRALFVGNSFTARNDVPGTIARLAAASGRALDHRLISAGGASLRRHWNAGTVQASLATEPFDVVVLQEQSTLPVKNANRMHENIRLLDAAIRSAGARTVLYMTWARKNEPHNQRAIADAYASIGHEIGAVVAPVGLAWERFTARHDTPALHDRDLSHPTVAGSYLAACVLYKALFGRKPSGLGGGVPGLTAAEVKALEKAAVTRPLQ